MDDKTVFVHICPKASQEIRLPCSGSSTGVECGVTHGEPSKVWVINLLFYLCPTSLSVGAGQQSKDMGIRKKVVVTPEPRDCLCSAGLSVSSDRKGRGPVFLWAKAYIIWRILFKKKE